MERYIEEVGDRIVIVKKDSEYEPYEVGDIFTIGDIEHNVTVTECGLYLFREEYRLVEDDNIFPKATSDKEMVDELIKHFLGESWYSVNPMPRAQVNTEALNLIKENFPNKKGWSKWKKFF